MSSDGPPSRRGKSGAQDALEGVVVLGTVAAGSKSARTQPVLLLDDGSRADVHVEGDNPFEEATLAARVGSRCRAQGVWRNGVLRVAGIEVIEDGADRKAEDGTGAASGDGA